MVIHSAALLGRHMEQYLPGPPKVCRIMAFMAIIMGLGLLFYIPLGFRYMLCTCHVPRMVQAY